VPMATVVCEGPRWTPQPLPTTLIPFLDLRTQPVARTRTVAFVEQNTSDGGVLFLIDSGNGLGPQLFDPNRVDIQVKLNTVEEWIITNPSPDLHPFHIHVNDFQVTGISGSATGAIVFTPVDVKGGDDTYPIPIGGAFRMRTLFKDFVGKFVIHCHILQHEDAGMMAVVEVIP
jgi:suppressor of ftsI